MNDNYRQHHLYTTIHEAEHHTDHNQETITRIHQTKETIEATKDIAIQIIIIIEVSAIIGTIITEVELTVITEIIIITDTIIVYQAPDIQTKVTQDSSQHTTEIIIITIITKIITDKDITVKIQTEMTNTDNVLVVIIDIIRTILLEIIEEIHHKKNKTTNITLENDEHMEINIITTTRTELIM